MTEKPLAYNLFVAAKKYHGVFLQELQDLDIERYHFVLVLIHDHKERLTQKELANLLAVDKSYMVTIINYFTKKGYVRREKDKLDRRCQHIKLTEKAKAIIPEIQKAVVDLNRKALKDIPESEAKIFREVFTKIQTNLSEETADIIIN